LPILYNTADGGCRLLRILPVYTGAYYRQMPYLDIIIFSFHYLLDPKVAENVSAEMSKESIIVFDEAHNIGEIIIPIKSFG
jgi:Rad3-related DNA helicase